ncbi:hypothetical protein [Novosphingobium sp.]|uniref:hypothetical protein n=1 Tax=Novosphingobium sp. TaxID=1874826 RepID=UPI003D0E8D78
MAREIGVFAGEVRVGGKDKKADRKADKIVRAAALREFLVAMPAVFERVAASFGWLVVLGALALVALVLHLAFGGRRMPPVHPAENPVAALYVRDLGRVADGRHTFDLVYDVALPGAGGPRDRPDFSIDRLALGDATPIGDVAEMSHAPGLFDDPAARHGTGGIGWRVVAQSAVVACGPGTSPAQAQLEARHLAPTGAVNCAGGLVGAARNTQAHYRIVARVDQFADVAIGFGHSPPPRGWFGGHRDDDLVGHAGVVHEEVQLGAVLRAHCALGVKVRNGEVRSLCAN